MNQLNGLKTLKKMPNSLHTYKKNLKKMSYNYPSRATRSPSHQDIRNKLFSDYALLKYYHFLKSRRVLRTDKKRENDTLNTKC